MKNGGKIKIIRTNVSFQEQGEKFTQVVIDERPLKNLPGDFPPRLRLVAGRFLKGCRK